MEEPLLPYPTAAVSAATADTSPSTTTIITRLSAVLLLATVSVWANHEASKGFEIAVLSSGAAASPAGRRFDVMFVSNGRAARIVHGASRSLERALFPDGSYPRKPVRRVTLQLASHNISSPPVSSGNGDYVISVSPSLVLGPDAGAAVESAVHRGMARVWLWDGEGEAPPELLNAVAEYLTNGGAGGGGGADGPCWAAGGGFLRYCEEQREGFVARLNREMQWRWSERAMDDALGSSALKMCAVYRRRAVPGDDATSNEPWRV